jgi:hypothetical protein
MESGSNSIFVLGKASKNKSNLIGIFQLGWVGGVGRLLHSDLVPARKNRLFQNVPAMCLEVWGGSPEGSFSN